MSETSLMAGYIVKVRAVTDKDKIIKLIENFDVTKLNKWQKYYDDSGFECRVNLTEYEYEYCGYYEHIISSSMISEMTDNFIETHKKKYKLNSKHLAHFVKIWYNGCEMGPIIEENNNE